MGLNRRAQVTLDRVWPIDKSTRQVINSPEHLRQLNFVTKLKRSSAKMNAHFIEYRPITGSWVFEVRTAFWLRYQFVFFSSTHAATLLINPLFSFCRLSYANFHKIYSLFIFPTLPRNIQVEHFSKYGLDESDEESAHHRHIEDKFQRMSAVKDADDASTLNRLGAVISSKKVNTHFFRCQ